MLVRIGARTNTEDVVDLLAGCHARIRQFLTMSQRLATDAASDDDVRDTAAQIHRYFTSAFLDHVLDEDELITPRLVGRSDKLDAILAAMHRDHAQHAGLIRRLVSECEIIEKDPRLAGALGAELLDIAKLLEAELVPHLELEERELFPAIRGLPQSVRDEIREAMRQRREQR
ncbi:MAG TPA: hemerythrin domain-containing protein [Kofleriaceae bacterium]|nr:hemerythrin domain-containing protein [Kofleriaceae bacterium]